MSLPSAFQASGPLPSATFAGWDAQTEQKAIWVPASAAAVGPAGAIQFSDGAGALAGTANALLSSNGDIVNAGNCSFATNPAANGVAIGTLTLPLGAGGLRVAGNVEAVTTLSVGAAATFGADITMTAPGGVATLPSATITTLLNGSFNQTAGASIVAPSGQYTMRFGFWRFTWGLSQAANGAGDTGAVVFNTPFIGVPCVFASPASSGTDGYFSPTNVTATQIGNLHGTTTGGTGFSVSAFWLAIGQA